MSGSVVVTGASSGLGLVASTRLAEAGRHVVPACRSASRGAAAEDRIRTEVPGASLEVLTLDVASLSSEAAAVLRGRPPLEALVCNAGVQIVDGVRRSPDGHELTFATNHLGHFLLATLLAGDLADGGRIVIVSSGTHYGPPRSIGFPGPRWDYLHRLADPSAQDPSPKAGRVRYSTSKLANIYMAYLAGAPGRARDHGERLRPGPDARDPPRPRLPRGASRRCTTGSPRWCCAWCRRPAPSRGPARTSPGTSPRPNSPG